MQDKSKSEQFDSLKKLAEMGPRLGGGEISVVEDLDSRASGPTPESAAVIKSLCDTFGDNLKRVGLELGTVGICWGSTESPEQVYDRLRGMRLISDERSLPSLFSA
jgi:hypothetical protein